MTVVFKFGGSVLTLDRLAVRLRTVLEMRAAQRRLIVTGGGAVADVVRQWSRLHHLDDDIAHWMAVSSLDLNRQLLQELLECNSVRSRAEADSIWDTDCSPLCLEMTPFLSYEETVVPDHLPHDWNVTSDSLAAWVAIRWAAEELVMVKSVPVPWELTAEEASTEGLVDAYFPRVAGQLQKISWCDLHASTPSIELWLPHPHRDCSRTA